MSKPGQIRKGISSALPRIPLPPSCRSRYQQSAALNVFPVPLRVGRDAAMWPSKAIDLPLPTREDLSCSWVPVWQCCRNSVTLRYAANRPCSMARPQISPDRDFGDAQEHHISQRRRTSRRCPKHLFALQHKVGNLSLLFTARCDDLRGDR